MDISLEKVIQDTENVIDVELKKIEGLMTQFEFAEKIILCDDFSI